MGSCKGRAVYFDCFAGISGDMVIGALFDLGTEKLLPVLVEALGKLQVNGLTVDVSRVDRHGLRGTKAVFACETDQPHRTWGDIREIITGAGFSSTVTDLSLAAFRLLAEAEGRVHGCAPEEVHFHEVGAWDSIADIVGTMILLETLEIKEVYASSVPIGTGMVESRHGLIPVPAPATLEILQGCPVRGGVQGEAVTPTGAVILRALVKSFGLPPGFKVEKTGYGAGNRPSALTEDGREFPNLLRVCLGESSRPGSQGPGGIEDGYWIIEANLDDMNPEWYGHLTQSLREQGAVETYLASVQMKKGRPGVVVTALAPSPRLEACCAVFFRESTTAGVRYYPVQRKILSREAVNIQVNGEMVQCKAIFEEEIYRVKPEYDECQRLADKWHKPLPEVYRLVNEAIQGWLQQKNRI